MTEIWGSTVNNSMPDIRRQAIEMEAAGFDGCYMSDSQNIRMECWVSLTVAALATTTIQVGPFVTNPLTRHLAVTAGAAATLQEVTGGRVVLAMGRGDSSLANIGYGPTPLGQFEGALVRLQAYLRGEGVDFDRQELGGVPAVEDLGYKKLPETSRIHYLPSARPKVPLNVVASGRRVLALGARLADEVTLVVGGDVGTLTEGMEYLRSVRRDAGLDPDSLAISAMLPVVVDADEERARRRISAQVGEVGRWMTLQAGQSVSPDDETESAFRASVAHYDMTQHGPTNSLETPAITNTLPTTVLKRHGLAGRPEEVAERFQELLGLGLKRIVVPHDPAFSEHVLPRLERS